MKASILPALLAAVMLVPAGASASGALDQASGAAHDPAMFDGGRARSEASLVTPGAPADTRTAPRTSAGDASRGAGPRTVVPGPDAVAKPAEEGSKWFTKPLVQTSLQGAAIGLLIGSLFGPVGLIAGPLLGAALFYGMKKYDEIKAEKAKIKPE